MSRDAVRYAPGVFDTSVLYMNQRTITALNQLNTLFYSEVAESFSKSRQYAWKSWQRFLELSKAAKKTPCSFADVGCGNARFLEWLQSKNLDFSYLGVDSNLTLLNEARAKFPAIRFDEKDIVQALLQGEALLPSPHDCIVLFGVFHHIPSFMLRKRLLEEIAGSLTPGGEIWLTAWVPQQATLNAEKVSAQLGFPAEELEPGDGFLGWKQSASVRYVHALQLGEMKDLLADTNLKIQAEWQETAKGERGNSCFLLTA